MARAIVPIVVVLVAIAGFYLAKDAFGWTLGIRTYWPVLAALFLYSYYVLSIDQKNDEETCDSD